MHVPLIAAGGHVPVASALVYRLCESQLIARHTRLRREAGQRRPYKCGRNFVFPSSLFSRFFDSRA